MTRVKFAYLPDKVSLPFSLFKLSQAKIFKKSKQQIPLLKDLISTEYTSAS